MIKRDLAPPTPQVQYLSALFRGIQNGEIRIPAFQRQFVWTGAQVIALLESVYKGYPIGSILFWRVEDRTLKIEQHNLSTFPPVPERYPILFILDGMQRLTTLYGVFHYSEGMLQELNVVFDLRKEGFRQSNGKDLPEAYIALSAVFSPKQLLEAQRSLGELEDGDVLIERSIQLHTAFQEYLIPTVTISHREVTEVVEIFERVNSTGTSLNAVDFMRALTWSADFDLSAAIDQLKTSFNEERYYFDPETLVKLIAVALDKEPTLERMMALRNAPAPQLHTAVRDTAEVLRRVIDFLQARFNIYSSDFIPYEGQVLVLAKLFKLSPTPPNDVLDVIERWIWSVGISELLRGRPDYYVVRLINSVPRILEREYAALELRVDLTTDDLVKRRFIRGKALSSTIATMFAVNGARSLVTGELIDPEEYMAEFSNEHFVGLLKADEMRPIFTMGTPQTKSFATIVLVTEADRKALGSLPARLFLLQLIERFGDDANTILQSQFIPRFVADLLIQGKLEDFVLGRAITLQSFAHRKVYSDTDNFELLVS